MLRKSITGKLVEARDRTQLASRSPQAHYGLQHQAAAVDRLVEITANWHNSRATRTQPSARQPSAESVVGERQKLRQMMASPASAYWRGPTAEANQARYRELIAREGQGLTDGEHDRRPEK